MKVPRFLLLLLLTVLPLTAQPPALEKADVRLKMAEMTKAHATQKELNAMLVQRALRNYVELLDPTKTYLTETEVDPWINASQDTLNETLAGYTLDDYRTFETIHAQMLTAIERREALERAIDARPLPQGVKADEFKEIEWAADEAALQERLLRLRALQMEVSAKVSDDDPERARGLLEKRRRHREQQLMGTDASQQEQIMLGQILKATAHSLDSQTAYFTPEEAHNFMIDLQQRLFGIGVQLRDSLDGFMVMRVIDGGPAARQGDLQEEDQIIAVNGESVIGLDIAETVQKIRGKAGTPVTITVLRETGDDPTRLDIPLTRGEVVLKEARIESSYEPVDGGIVGRVALYSFYQDRNSSSTADIREAIEELQTHGEIKGLILDLRRNTGGLLPQAIGVTGLFIKKGIVASIRDNDGRIQYLRDAGSDMAFDGPLIVLVSRLSASASEIVAGSLQDYGRAIIVGDETTFGKGTFQTSTIDTMGGQRVDPKGEFKVTRGTYFTVSGRSPQLVGVKSDVVAPGAFSELELGERYAKYPLDNDSIPPNFDDDLSDIPFRYREQIRRTYHYDLEQRTSFYTRHIPALQARSAKRQAHNTDYQAFLVSLTESDVAPDTKDNDHQLKESFSVMEDLITLTEKN